MRSYICELCDFNSNIKTHFRRHLQTNKHIKNKGNYDKDILNEHKMSTNEHKMSTNEHKNSTKIVENINVIKQFNCHHCDETFTTIPNKRRHELHYCKNNLDLINNIIKLKNKEIIKIEKDKNKQIEQLEKKVDKLTDKIGYTTHIQNNIHGDINSNNNNNTIKINSYGNEDISHITDAFKTEMLKIPYGAIPKMIEAVHFNDMIPENKNVILPNVNKNIIKIKRGDKWVYRNKDELLKDMIDSKYLILDDHFDLVINGEKLSTHNKKNYMKFRTTYDNKNDNLINDIKSDCELMILNNRDNIQ